MYCSKCGKEYAGGTMLCPYCGANSQTGYVPFVAQAEPKYNVCAIVGFVLSLVSLFFSLYGAVTVASVVLSAIALKEIKATNEKGRGLAIAGLVIGIFTLVMTVVAVILAAVFVTVLPSVVNDLTNEWMYSF